MCWKLKYLNHYRPLCVTCRWTLSGCVMIPLFIQRFHSPVFPVWGLLSCAGAFVKNMAEKCPLLRKNTYKNKVSLLCDKKELTPAVWKQASPHHINTLGSPHVPCRCAVCVRHHPGGWIQHLGESEGVYSEVPEEEPRFPRLAHVHLVLPR